MRGVALATNDVPSFSVSGTVGIAVIYTLALLPGAVALAASGRRWPWVVYGGGIAFLMFSAVNIGSASVADNHDMTAARWLVTALLISAMAAVYALHFRWVARLARRPLQRPVRPPLRRNLIAAHRGGNDE
jgi:hypothetical protein